MTHYKVFYDHFDGIEVPIWLVLNIRENKIDWTNCNYSFQVQAPFDLHPSEYFDQFALNVSITMDELTLNSKEHHIGINLDLVKSRIIEHDVNFNDVSNFVIQMSDLEEVLSYTIGD
ncbi:hypothetical protein [Metabacillus halosaccharovorans]|uniref:Uncharacterized protein n=1 Tax=Metabacillus halosaccharovorans TaxID=930124 RepID=A0ABT3DHC3_9BACI|nr:hypothetical protein [Metabacillus halosaccharovorans]MCV9886276.1 hypothetical protein [Metabacillus halosaccharovorans]